MRWGGEVWCDVKAGPGLTVGSSQSIFLSLVSEGDGVPRGSSVGHGDGDQTTAAASPGLLGLSPLGLGWPPLGGGVLGSELSAGPGGLGGSPGGGPAPAPLGLVPVPGGGSGSGTAVGAEPGAASPPLLGSLVHGSVSRSAILLLSRSTVAVVSGSAVAVGSGPLVSVVVVFVTGSLSGAIGISGRSSSSVGVCRSVIGGIVLVITGGSAIRVISWRSAIAVNSWGSAIRVVSGGRSAIAVGGGSLAVVVVVVSRSLGSAVAVHRGGGGGSVGVGRSLVTSGGHTGLLATSPALLEPVPSSSSVLLAGVTSAVSTATVGQRSAVASSVVSGTVEAISSHEGEKACEEREIRNQLSDCVTGTGQIVNIEWSVPGCLSSVWGHPQPSQGCSVLPSPAQTPEPSSCHSEPPMQNKTQARHCILATSFKHQDSALLAEMPRHKNCLH